MSVPTRLLLLLTLAAGGAHAEEAAPRTLSFMFKQPVPVSTITETIAQLGGVNVVVGPGLDTPIALTLREATASAALADLAKAAGLTVTAVPYITGRPTYLVTRRPVAAAALRIPAGLPATGAMQRLTFGRPTPLATLLETLAAQGRFSLAPGDLPEVDLSLNLRDVSPREALHLLAHLLDLEVERDETAAAETWSVRARSDAEDSPSVAAPSPGLPAASPASPSPEPVPSVTGVRPPAIPPVRFGVNAIVADNIGFTAVIEYAGETFLVRPGTLVPDPISPRFEVKDVEPDCVEVFDRESKRLVRHCLEP